MLNPSQERLAELISSKLEAFGVSEVVYSFFLSPPVPALPWTALEKLQQRYIILAWNPEDGAEVELPEELRLSVRASEEEIKVGLRTRYQFEFARRASEFSVRAFVDWLLEAS